MISWFLLEFLMTEIGNTVQNHAIIFSNHNIETKHHTFIKSVFKIVILQNTNFMNF